MPEATQTEIFHITHLNNLAGILAEDCLWSDRQRIERGFVNQNIGYSHIKERRMRHPVQVSQGGMLGHYVPFNFCPRSVMLYVVNNGHENYPGGQQDILHLVSDIDTIQQSGRPWFFTARHADLLYATQYDDLTHLDELNWDAINAKYWSTVAEQKQAEFLVHDFLPWSAIIKIGVVNQEVAERVKQVLADSPHQPQIIVRPEWYY